MSKKIYLDPGHGGNDPGATGNGLQEKDVTLKIALYTRAYLNDNYNSHTVKMSRTTDKTVSLSQRTNEANQWGTDVFVSPHVNAGGGSGYEDYIFNRLSSNSKTTDLQDAIHKEVSKLFSTNRGKKKANFHVLRETRGSAVLTENGFIDNSSDASFLKNDTNLKKLGEAHGKGIANFLGLKKKQKYTGKKKTFYRVVTGSFKEKKNAERRMDRLQSDGFSSFIDFQNDYYRVVTGSFTSRDNADNRVDELDKKGYESFIDIYRE